MAKKKAKKKVTKKATKKKVAKKKITKKVAKKKAKKKVAKKKITKKKVAKKVTKKKVAKKATKKKVIKKAATSKTVKKIAKKVASKAIKNLKNAVKNVVAKKSAAPKKQTIKKAKTDLSKKKVSNKKGTSKAKKVVIDQIEDEIIEEIKGIKIEIKERISDVGEKIDWDEIHEMIMNPEFFDQFDGDECFGEGCDNLAILNGFCRLHYIKNWKKLIKKKEVLTEGKLQEQIQAIMEKYPLKDLESIFNDLTNDKRFNKVLKDLNIETPEMTEEDFEGDDDSDLSDISAETQAYKAVKKVVVEES